MSLIKYPYTNLHELNLDWLIEEVKKCFSPDNPPTNFVLSVNGLSGTVTLYTDPAVNFPEVEDNSWSIGRTAGGVPVGIKFNKTLPLQRMNGTSLFNIYDAGNPPPYPVTSVNGSTGDVIIQVAFNSLSGETISFITPSPDHSWSLDRETADGAISLKLDTTNNTPSAYLEYVSSDETITRTIKLLTPDDIPSSSGVVSVNGEAGVVTLTGDDIPKEDNSSISVASAINGLEDDTENLANKIGNTAMGTTATTVTGAVKEHSTAISNVNTKIGNVGNTSLQDQINTLNSKLTGATSWNEWTQITLTQNCEAWNETRYIKIGKIVYIMISVKGLTPNTNVTVANGSIPSGYRPLQRVEFDGFGGSEYLNHAHITITTTGDILIYSADTYATGFISYPAASA